MRALFRVGQPADALRAYHRLAERLADDLGVAPGREARGLFEEILRADSGPSLGAEPELPKPYMRSGLAVALCNSQRPADALPQFERCLEIRRETQAAPRLIIIALVNLGAVLGELRRSAEAVVYLEEALEIIDRNPDQGGVTGTVLNNLGFAYRMIEANERALAYYRRALALAEGQGDDLSIAMAATNLGDLWASVGDNDQAEALFETALGHATRASHWLYQGRAHTSLGLVMASIGRLDEARVRLELAIEAYGDKPQQGVDELRSRIHGLEAVEARSVAAGLDGRDAGRP